MQGLDRYRRANPPSQGRSNLAWHTYGTGIESIGSDGLPESVEIPAPGSDEMLVRVDAVGLCYSDVKLIRFGGDHPKLYGRDLASDPIRLGHEVTVTVMQAGDDLKATYRRGDRLAIQPDIYIGGRSMSYGYTHGGGLIQYDLIGADVLAGDDGAYVIPVDESIGYAAAALSEPWACVEAAYTQRRRLGPLDGGTLWIIGHRDDRRRYDFADTLRGAARVLVTGLSPEVHALVVEAVGAHGAVRDTGPIEPSEYGEFSAETTDGQGFDDIIVLDLASSEQVTQAARCIAFRGTMNLVGTRPLDDPCSIDFGRLHYDYTAYVGTSGPDISAAYGEQRNRCDLRPGGVAVFVGAGGPMGQMHVQRALEKLDGPSVIVAVDPDADRLGALQDSLGVLVERSGRDMILIDPGAAGSSSAVERAVADLTDGAGADDVVVTAPVASVMADSARLLRPDGMLVLFAGVPNGTTGPLDMSNVYLGNVQFTGTSGSTLADQQLVLQKALAGTLSPDLNLAAVGGIEAARDGMRAVMEGRYAGKVVIFPQVEGLPLLSLTELAERYPRIGAALGDRGQWTPEAERVLIEDHAAAH